MTTKIDSKLPVTNERLQGAVDSITRLLDKILGNQEDNDKRLKGHDKRFDKIESVVVENSRKIDALKADLADTPSRKEFGQLKRKVERYHPSN